MATKISSSNGNKRRKYSDGGVILGFMLFMLIIYLGGYIHAFISRERVPETVVVMGSIEPVLVFNGVIIRDETVYRSNAHGILVYHMQDREKVRAGGLAASVQDEAAVLRYMQAISAIEAEFYRDQGTRNLSMAAESELRNLDTQLARAVDGFAPAMGAFDIQALYSLSQRADHLVGRRNQILFNETHGAIGSIWGIYQTQLSGAISEIRIGPSGIISYRTDGYEDIFTPARLRVLSREETLTYVDFSNIFIPALVAPGDPLFKIINSNIWHIAAYLPVDQVEGWYPGASRTIYLDDGRGNFNPINTRIHMVERRGIEAYVVFTINSRVADFLDRRSVAFMVRQTFTEGFKIPNTAIAEKTLLRIPAEAVIQTPNHRDPRQVLRYNPEIGGFDRIDIFPFQTTSEFVTIVAEYNNIGLGDIISVPDRFGETRTITHSEQINVVYVTNTGTAVMRRIHLTGNVQGNINYTILDPSVNSALRLHDRIASDARMVSNGRLIL